MQQPYNKKDNKKYVFKNEYFKNKCCNSDVYKRVLGTIFIANYFNNRKFFVIC